MRQAKFATHNLTPLQRFVLSQPFDTFIMAVIFCNCIFMAMVDPKIPPDEPDPFWQRAGTTVFNCIFIGEICLHLAAFGLVRYLMDPWHLIDAIVGAVASIELGIVIVTALARLFGFPSPENVSVVHVLRLLRTLRVLRPLKSISFIPSVSMFVEGVLICINEVVLNALLWLFALGCLAFVSFHLIGDSLNQRCVPDNSTYLTNPLVLNDVYYQQYGIDYYYSRYNDQMCGNTYTCADGFNCESVKVDREGFYGVQANFATPWKSFISNLAFATLRGWPNIFWAIARTNDKFIAVGLLVLIPSVTTLFIVNIFPAIFIIALQSGEERSRKLEWLQIYPGDVEVVTELELMVWASQNQDFVMMKKDSDRFFPVYSFITWLTNGKARAAKLKAEREAILAKGDTVEARNLKHTMAVEDEDDMRLRDYGKTRVCVLRGRVISAARAFFCSDIGPFSKFMALCVILNISSLGLDTYPTKSDIYTLTRTSNLVFSVLFLVEVFVKISLLGPCLYFDNLWNILDFTLAAFSIPVFVNDQFSFINNFRSAKILRLAKLARIARVYKVVKAVDVMKARKSRSFTVGFGTMIIMVDDIIPYVGNVIILFSLALYVFTVLGMEFFVLPTADPVAYDIHMTYNQSLIAPLHDVSMSWTAGRYFNRMNWNNFLNGYVTMFNIAAFNGWYIVMIDCLNRAGYFFVFFFLLFMFITNYFLLATFLSATVNVMESHANSLLLEIANDNKRFVEHLSVLRNRVVCRLYFHQLRQNTMEEGSGAAKDSNSATAKRPEVADKLELPEDDSLWNRIFVDRAEYSFYLFGPESFFRRMCTKLEKSFVYQYIIAAAIFFAIVSIITSQVGANPNGTGGASESILTATQWEWINDFCTAAFLFEMLLKMIVHTTWGCTNSYINDYMNILDMFINVAMLLAQFTEITGVRNLRIIRLLKLPTVIKGIFKSQSLKNLLEAIETAFVSVFNTFVVAFGTCFILSVICLQIWMGTTGYCDYPGYPGGQYETQATSEYPYGCATPPGVTTMVKSNLDQEYHPESLYWKNSIDSFDDLIHAGRSIFRIIMQNEWQGVVYGVMDVVDAGAQPIVNHSRENFIFIFLIWMLFQGLTMMSIAVVYYHFYVLSALRGRKLTFGGNDAFWGVYEDKLRLIQPAFVAKSPATRSDRIRSYLHRLQQSLPYRLVFALFGLIPAVVMLTYYEHTYATVFWVLLDCVFTTIYLGEYITRIYVVGPYFYRGLMGKQELIVVSILCASFAVSWLHYLTGTIQDYKYVWYLQQAATCVRFYRVAVSFPTLAIFLRVIEMSLSGFAPLSLYLAMVILIFGVAGFVFWGSITPDYQDEFLNAHYNFNSLSNSMILLMGIGTGNFYSEIVHAYAMHFSLGLQFCFELYLFIFYGLFFVVMKCFGIMMISKYMIHYGGGLGLAAQQVKAFQRAWLKLGNSSFITFDEFLELLQLLPYPLGVKGKNLNFLDVTRYAKRVLLCVPRDVSHFDDSNPQKSRQLYPYDSLPQDIRDLPEHDTEDMPGYSTMTFSFRQLIIATHKCAIINQLLPDEMVFQASRVLHKERCANLRLILARLIISRSVISGIDDYKMSSRSLLMLQRLDKKLYRQTFLKIMTDALVSLRKRTLSCGFKGIDSLFISILRKAVIWENEAGHKQYDLARFLNPPGALDPTYKAELEAVKQHLVHVRRIEHLVNDLYEENVDKLWNISTLQRMSNVQEKQGCTALAIDSSSNIYAAFGTKGILKIWRCAGHKGGDINERSVFKMEQKINVKGHVRCIAVSHDSKKLVCTCNNEVIIYTMKLSGRRVAKKMTFTESSRLRDHSGPVNCLQLFGQYIITCGQDGYVYLWNYRSTEPLNYISLGSPIFSATVLHVADANDAVDEITLADCLVCGTQGGDYTSSLCPCLKCLVARLPPGPPAV